MLDRHFDAWVNVAVRDKPAVDGFVCFIEPGVRTGKAADAERGRDVDSCVRLISGMVFEDAFGVRMRDEGVGDCVTVETVETVESPALALRPDARGDGVGCVLGIVFGVRLAERVVGVEAARFRVDVGV